MYTKIQRIKKWNIRLTFNDELMNPERKFTWLILLMGK